MKHRKIFFIIKLTYERYSNYKSLCSIKDTYIFLQIFRKLFNFFFKKIHKIEYNTLLIQFIYSLINN
jgi:hypothetical protein